jgi:hypothetical protein
MRSSLSAGKAGSELLSKAFAFLVKESPYGLFRYATPLALLYLLLSLAGALSVYDLYLALWACAVLAWSLLANADSRAAAQSAAAIVPVLVSAMGFWIIGFAKRQQILFAKWVTLAAACLAVAIPVSKNARDPINPDNAAKEHGTIQTSLASALADAMKSSNSQTLVYYVDDESLFGMADYLAYFAPGANAFVVNGGELEKRHKETDESFMNREDDLRRIESGEDIGGGLAAAALRPAVMPERFGQGVRVSFEYFGNAYDLDICY